MQFSSTLIEAKLLRRYKRFLADVIFKNGEKKTVYCPNPGSMLGLTDKNTKIWLQESISKNSKYKFIWRLVESNTGKLICIDTQMANKVVYENLLKREIPELKRYKEIISEPKVADGSRLDFLLKSKGEKSCFIEVKSSTLSRFPNISEFPDSVTARGSKHLSLLTNLKNDGFRAIQIYLIQRSDTNFFKIAKDIDHQYFKSFQIAKKSGVEILVLQSLVSKDGIELSQKRLSVL